MSSMIRNGSNEEDDRPVDSADSELQPLSKPSVSQENFLVTFADRKSPSENLFRLFKDGALSQTTAPDHVLKEERTTTWQGALSMFFIQVLNLLATPVHIFGRIVGVIGNTIIVNGGFLRTFVRLLASALFFFNGGPLIIPANDSVDYKSVVGLIDPRTTLLAVNTSENEDAGTESFFAGAPVTGGRRLVDAMLMAAKLCYENKTLVENVVTNTWKMNLVGFYNCWNEYQQRWSTQAFVFTDQPENANSVVLVWRGTDPFDTYDWSTDLDFSWYDLQDGIGRVHVGFLEALGLSDRKDMNTFARMRENAYRRRHRNSRDDSSSDAACSGLSQDLIDAPEKSLAYDDVTKLVKGLMKKNPNAKLLMTGHSLGGALAILYAGMLYYFTEPELAGKIAAVYTFGQPRVGDKDFGTYMLEKLSADRYYRVVYCNDIVPRIPFDDDLFLFTHWGVCYYFDSFYHGQTLREAPDENYFSPKDFFKIHINAVWELINSLFILTNKYGSEYRESTASTVFRVIALFLPGLGSHSPVNYVNSVRLGTPFPLLTTNLESDS